MPCTLAKNVTPCQSNNRGSCCVPAPAHTLAKGSTLADNLGSFAACTSNMRGLCGEIAGANTSKLASEATHITQETHNLAMLHTS